MNDYGLIGKKLSHSFSKQYFTDKFKDEGLSDHSYSLFELDSITDLPSLLKTCKSLRGFNVTIPFKQEIIPFLDFIDPVAFKTGAVNTIKISVDNTLRGYNTDVFGFEKSLFETIDISKITGALVLGTGGASKAVQFVLKKAGIKFLLIGRRLNSDYKYLFKYPEVIEKNNLIINTTPLGMFPQIDIKPNLPYNQITPNHILIDLVYNPAVTAFLDEGLRQGALVKNGLDMLHYQAEMAWQIWNDKTI